MKDEQAKCIAYAWQLSIENQVIQELKQIESADELNSEEREFLCACLTAAGGNVFSAIVMARYGGEQTRLASAGN